MARIHLDRIAISLSSLCAIHCVALPIVAIIMPLLSSTIEHGSTLHEFWFHRFILIFILPISIFALVSGYRCHKQVLPVLIASIGLVILLFTAMFADNLITKHALPHSGETILTILAGIIHAAGHILNMLATRSVHLHQAGVST